MILHFERQVDPVILDVVLLATLDEGADGFALAFVCAFWTLVDANVGVVAWLRRIGSGCNPIEARKDKRFEGTRLLGVMLVRLGGGRSTGAYGADEHFEQASVTVSVGIKMGNLVRTYVTISTLVSSQVKSSDVLSVLRKGILSIEKKQALP